MRIIFEKSSGRIVDRLEEEAELKGLKHGFGIVDIDETPTENIENIDAVLSVEMPKMKAKKLKSLRHSLSSYLSSQCLLPELILLIVSSVINEETLKELTPFKLWIKGIIDKYYERIEKAQNGESISELLNIPDDFSDFDKTKPLYYLKSIRDTIKSENAES